MENASKALLIAATVLIAIIMVGTGVYLYSLYTKQTKLYNETVSATEIQKFNSQFEVYLGRTNITPQEIVSIVNLAKEYDVEIYLGATKLNIAKSEDFIKSNQGASFKCESQSTPPNPMYDESGRIIRITFTK